MDKKILLASFVFPERLDWFKKYLKNKFNINNDKIFVFKNLNDESKVIVTFKLIIPNNKFLDINNLFPNALIIHKRGNALYTINALNKLIEFDCKCDFGNLDYKSYFLDWSKYQNKLILINNGVLILYNIDRIF